MTHRNRLCAATLLGLWLGACGRVEDPTTDGDGSAQPAGAGAAGSVQLAGVAAGGSTGTGGEPTINLVLMPNAGQPGFYPPPFDANSCPTPVPTWAEGTVRCVTRAQLADSNFPNVSLDGGVSALGPADARRCPQLNEITFSGACGGERCCDDGACGPLTRRSSTANPGASDAGAAGDGGAGTSEQSCCYYVLEMCGV